MPPARIQAQHAAWVADGQRPDPVLDGPAGDGLGGLVLGLPYPAPVPAFGRLLAAPVLAPPP